MEAHQLLLEQTRHHYRWLEQAVGDFDEVLTGQQPLPGRPSLAWQVAHLIEQVETTAEALCGLPRPSEPPPTGWDELRQRLRSCTERALAGFAALDVEDLEAAPMVPLHPAFEESLRTRQRWWSGHVFHVAYHLGQIGSLRAAHGLDWHS